MSRIDFLNLSTTCLFVIATIAVGYPRHAFSHDDHESIEGLTKCFSNLQGSVLYSDFVSAAPVYAPKPGVIVEGSHPASRKPGVYLYQEDGSVSFYVYPEKYLNAKSRVNQPFILCAPGSSCDVSQASSEPAYVNSPAKRKWVYQRFWGGSAGDLKQNKGGRFPDPINPEGRLPVALQGGEVLDLTTPERKEALLKPLRDSLRKLVGNQRLLKQSVDEESQTHGQDERGHVSATVDECLKATHDPKITAALFPLKTKEAASPKGPAKDGEAVVAPAK